MKKYLFYLPEIILVILSAYWLLDNFIGRNYFNPYAFGILVLLVFQILFQNKYIGYFLATIISLFSLYMVLAVFSEFNDFPTANSEAILFLLAGLLFCFLGFSSAIMIFYKFIPKVF